MIGDALRQVIAGSSLSRDAMQRVFRELMGGEADERQAAALLAALRMRGETLDEIVGAAEVVRDLAVPLPDAPAGAVDTCGTGGGGPNTFNISTAAALVVAAAGTPVAKHGNRRATSQCGSAEVLEQLGVPLDLAPSRMADCVHEIGIGFLFARACHPAFGAVAGLRAALPIPTLFNRLGPLVNPMRVRRHLLGVSDPSHLDLAVQALARLGAERAWVVHSEDGMDELSLGARAQVRSFEGGVFESFSIEPGRFLPVAPVETLRGGDAVENARRILGILKGDAGAGRDVVLLNAGAALVVAGHPEAPDLAAGIERAARAVDSGAAHDLLSRWSAWCAEAQAAGAESAERVTP